MAAPLSSPSDAPPGASISAASVTASETRVVSVSPREPRLVLEPLVNEAQLESPPNETTLDHVTTIETGLSSRNAIAEARTVAAQLAAVIAQGREGEAKAAKAVVHLHERLRLGAKMLKAFQTQISRVEAGLATLRSHEAQVRSAGKHIDEKYAAFEASVEATLTRTVARLDEAAQQAIDRFEQHVAARERELIALEERIASGIARVDALHQAIDAMEAQAAEAVNKSDAALQRLEGKINEAAELQRQCDEAVRMLARELLDAAGAIDQISTRSEEIQASAKTAIDESAAAENQLRSELSRLVEACTIAAETSKKVHAVEALLQRLAPWEKLLIEAEASPHGLPPPLAAVAGQLQKRIGSEMAQLLETLHSVSRRVEQLANLNPVSAAAKDETAESSLPAQTAEPKLDVGSDPDMRVDGPLRFQTWAGRSSQAT